MYRDLASALEGLVAGEPDSIANMANAAALIAKRCPIELGRLLPQHRWRAGAWAVSGSSRLHPDQFDQGVCGAAAKTRQVQRVEDVHVFPGHIACDSASNSEIVVPLIRDGEVLGVLDIDSPRSARFTEEDEAGVVKLAEILRE